MSKKADKTTAEEITLAQHDAERFGLFLADADQSLDDLTAAQKAHAENRAALVGLADALRKAYPGFDPKADAVGEDGTVTKGALLERSEANDRTRALLLTDHELQARSEERRVGKECRGGGWT